MLEAQTQEFLNNLLLDLPLARGALERGQISPADYLAALREAILWTPVFRDWPSPVPGWLAEFDQLNATVQDRDSAALIGVRRAVVSMRLGELEQALAALDAVQTEQPSLRCWQLVTRSRVLTRQHTFPAAQAALEQASTIRLEQADSVAMLRQIARGELELEQNDPAAQRNLSAALEQLPAELIEERVQLLQALGFLAIVGVDVRAALRALDEARQILRGAGVWSEVIQMNLVVGNLLLTTGKTSEAQRLLAEGLELCRQHDQPLLEPVLRVTLARAQVGGGDYAAAVRASVDAANQFAQRGQAIGYISMISYLARLYQEQRDFKQSYRTLATGVSIARRLRLFGAEQMFRTQIDLLRSEVLGPVRFDAMVEEMIRQAKAPPDSGAG